MAEDLPIKVWGIAVLKTNRVLYTTTVRVVTDIPAGVLVLKPLETLHREVGARDRDLSM